MANQNGPYLLGNGVHLAGFQFFLVRNHTTCVLLHYAEKKIQNHKLEVYCFLNTKGKQIVQLHKPAY